MVARKTSKKASATKKAASGKTASKKPAVKKPAAKKTAGKKAAARKTPSKKGAAKKASPKKAAAKQAVPKKADAKKAAPTKATGAKDAGAKAAPAAKTKRAADGISSTAVNMGMLFALRPRVNKSFRQDDFLTARRLLADESYATLEEAARAVAERALALSHEPKGRRGDKHRR